MSRIPLAFMSYVNEDDRHDNGWMTQFRERLSGEVRMHTGEPFDIFQDRKDITWGQQWQERINDALDATLFLIPILTPAFFKSTACRKELERFLKREETLGRSDLILPVYYVNCPVLQDEAKREHDKLAQVIAKGQYADWRDLRFEDFTSPQLRKALAKMAQQIMEALERSQAEASRQQSEKESEEPSSSANTFQSSGGPQNIAQGYYPIGTQNNYYYALPTPAIKTEPPVLIVDQNGSGDYATITDALKTAKSGTRILVRPGLYKEAIVIDKPVSIIGDGDRNEIVIRGVNEDTILFKANNGRIANITLRQSGIGVLNCVYIVQGSIEMENCDISGRGEICVLIKSGGTLCLRGCCIHDANGYAVVFMGKSQGVLEDNEIFANANGGILIIEGGDIALRRNRINFNAGTGISVTFCNSGIVEDNDLRGNTKGALEIFLKYEARVQRSGNKE